jgi:hypothetical protein
VQRFSGGTVVASFGGHAVSAVLGALGIIRTAKSVTARHPLDVLVHCRRSVAGFHIEPGQSGSDTKLGA